MTPKDILQLESTDIRQAYLFEENGHWYAYEHSANRIEKFVKGFVDFKHKVQDVCGRIKIEIDLNVLEKCSVTLCEDSLLILDCPTAYKPSKSISFITRYKRITQKLFVLFVFLSPLRGSL